MFNRTIIESVWQKAEKVSGFNPDLIRKDACGAWIVKNQYGNRNSQFGWEIDHVFPQAYGGQDDIDNLRAMHWENNQSKGYDYPVYFCAVQAENNTNVHKRLQFTVNERLQKTLNNLYR